LEKLKKKGGSMKSNSQEKFEKIKVDRQTDRIKIKIEADSAMRKRWEEQRKIPFYLTITKERIPKKAFKDGLRNSKEVKVFYATRKEAALYIGAIIRYNGAFRNGAGRELLQQLEQMGITERKLYAKVVQKKKQGGGWELKTIFLVGDETTGLLYYL